MSIIIYKKLFILISWGLCMQVLAMILHLFAILRLEIAFGAGPFRQREGVRVELAVLQVLLLGGCHEGAVLAHVLLESVL